ncbi:MAG: hypothetical protein FJ278_14290 [Planctomycetes bacterium]|nr:hypothetical protein [Planctomycetota bacterium]
MTGRERLRAAYRGRKVDRLPWAPIVDAGTLRDYAPSVRERGPHRFVAELGGDVLCRSCALFKTECAEVEVSARMVGDERVVEHRTPVGTLREALKLSSSGQWRYVQHLLNTPEDFRVFRFMLEHTRFTADYSAFDRVSAEVGQHGIIAPHCAATPVQ